MNHTICKLLPEDAAQAQSLYNVSSLHAIGKLKRIYIYTKIKAKQKNTLTFSYLMAQFYLSIYVLQIDINGLYKNTQYIQMKNINTVLHQ